MGFKQAVHIHFCLVENRAIFLDLESEHYSCLSVQQNAAFLDAVEHGNTSPLLEPLFDRGWLVQGKSHDRPRPASLRFPADTDYMDGDPVVSHLAVLEVVIRQICARHSVRRGGISNRVSRAAVRKEIWAANIPTLEAMQAMRPAIEGAITASRRAALLVSTHDQCLSTSLGLLDYLASRQVFPDWIFGVRLHPFSAHCWLQLRGIVIADRVDTVRAYTPILII